MTNTHRNYGWKDAEHTAAHDYTLPAVLKEVMGISAELRRPLQILDLGCGNGSATSQLTKLGHFVMGVDASQDGIDIARSRKPDAHFAVCSIYEDELRRIVTEPMDCVVSLDVIEHLFYPTRLLEQSFQILKAGGHLIISTPYHGYLKNLAISFANGWDRHFDVHKDGGHIKFFSERTLGRMARDVGFSNLRFSKVGRLPGIWKSMIMVAEKKL